MAAKGDLGLSRAPSALPGPGTALGVATAGLATGLALAVALNAVGPLGIAAVVALALGIVLLRFPQVALAILLVATVVFEPTDTGLLPPFRPFFEVLGPTSLTGPDLLLFTGLAGVLLRSAAGGERPRLPEPLTPVLALLGAAILAGAATGHYATAAVGNGELFHRAIDAAYLIFVPLLVVNVVRDTRALRVFVGTAAGLGALKALSGAYGALAGVGERLGSEAVSFFEPLPNLVVLVFMLGVLAALIRDVPVPRWLLFAAPLAPLAIVLSYRRSFWIAAIFTLAIVAIVASRRRGRVVMALAAVALVLALATSLTIGASDSSRDSVLAQRARTLNPSGADENRGDRYRNDERRNVIETLREEPLTGVGLGLRWRAHHPLAESNDRRYAHVALLWFWLVFGPLGPIAYVALMAAGLWTAARVWRDHPDPVVQVGAIACFGGLIGLIVVELTATFTAVEPRLTLIVGAALGWLAAAWLDLPGKRRPAPVP